ncbi:MAG: UTP--glucose-1-phosphate uridylyltransferase [Nocardioidaceae bacterium]|nr:UTP--glucose-1-phosphate uridylyltransferase [Nocardioidaceae bacterium]
MSADGLEQARRVMADGEMHPRAIAVFEHYYRELDSGATGMIAEADIEPLPQPTRLDDLEVEAAQTRDALARTAVIKLNGGLGTSMGMQRAKSLLPVRDDLTFLDMIVGQVRGVRAAHDVRLPLVFMNSFRTRDETLQALAVYPDLKVDGMALDFVQNREPKLRSDDLTPVRWPEDPTLEWCPPGHGDLYTALEVSGVLDALIGAGFRYATVSNSDNLGAAPDPRIVGWFAASGAPYAAEVCERTAADLKGGHLAVRKSDGRLVLRETAQTSPEDLAAFTDGDRHAYFHTNNLWFDLIAVRDTLREREGVLGLPLIRNLKTVDPGRPDSPEVVQIETAMGAAVEVFEGATALEVPRSRFLPVKTTNDLLLLRSDAYELGDDFTMRPVTEPVPLVDLDPTHYKRIGSFDERFPQGAPSLRAARSLTVRGDWTFGAGVRVVGDAELDDTGEPGRVADGSRLPD